MFSRSNVSMSPILQPPNKQPIVADTIWLLEGQHLKRTVILVTNAGSYSNKDYVGGEIWHKIKAMCHPKRE